MSSRAVKWLSPETFLLFAVSDEGRASVLGRVSFGGFLVREGQPVGAQGIIIPAEGAGVGARLLFCPFRDGDGWRNRRLHGARAHRHKVGLVDFEAVEGRDTGFDDFAQVMAEALDWGVAAGLVLKVGKADLPLWGAAAVLSGDLIQAPLQRSSQAEIVVRDRYHLVGFYRPHQPA
jgi:hypothetical protein